MKQTRTLKPELGLSCLEKRKNELKISQSIAAAQIGIHFQTYRNLEKYGIISPDIEIKVHEWLARKEQKKKIRKAS